MAEFIQYLVESNSIASSVLESLDQQSKEALERIADFTQSIGATSKILGESYIAGLSFDNPPDEKLWRKVTNQDGIQFWYPKRNTLAGKAISGKVRKLKMISSNDALMAFFEGNPIYAGPEGIYTTQCGIERFNIAGVEKVVVSISEESKMTPKPTVKGLIKLKKSQYYLIVEAANGL